MTPSLVLLMRHAEKPADPKDPDLSAAGTRRALELATYIPEKFGKPDRLFASALSRHSARPYETIKPLSKAVGVPIDATFANQDCPALAAELLGNSRYANQCIVIAWHHGYIPAFAADLRAPNGSYPSPWDTGVFNLILRFQWSGTDVPAVMQITEPF